MQREITIHVAGIELEATLNDSETAQAIGDALPIESSYNTWGDEIYFEIPIKMELKNGQDVVELGDLGYWPPGRAFCIFYGATPGSTEDEIRPASAVDIVGRITGDPRVLRTKAVSGGTIRIE